MGLFSKKSKEDILREQKYSKFNELDKAFEDDEALAKQFKANWLSSRARHLTSEADYTNAVSDYEE